MVLVFCSSGAMGGPREGASTWILQKGRDIPSPQPRKPMLRMQGDKLSGSTGCNNFTATATRRAEQRVAIEQVALTRMLCEPRQNTIEAAFVRALRQTEFITRRGSTLTFLSGERLPLLVWKRQRSASAGQHARWRMAQARSVKGKRAHRRKFARHRKVAPHRTIVHHRRVVHRVHCFWWH